MKIFPDNSLHQENHLKLLPLLESNPQMSQGDLSKALAVSLGTTNYCIKVLLDIGLIKLQNFHKNNNKMTYVYLLSPLGIGQKARMTLKFLKIKMQEYEQLRVEIADLKREAKLNSITKQDYKRIGKLILEVR
ncbi:MarR family EPS-associated transcriptional regulator [Methylomonas sp. AM2-LC]|uniref:MarR family EPS-associated transcriptional regulator n=1 Tax=Methylomonas sp. AM2-LC TaxID=3153301 RepID=UPI003262CE8E